jgi:hypothetical protein
VEVEGGGGLWIVDCGFSLVGFFPKFSGSCV